MRPIYAAIKDALIFRGWNIDLDAIPNDSDELREFIHPKLNGKFAWFDAIQMQMEMEEK